VDKILLIDDERTFDDATCIARNATDGIYELEHNGVWDKLYLDHDLGEDGTGYDVICWLEENPSFMPKEVVCVSANPPGRDRINVVIKKIYGELSVGYYAHETAIIDPGAKVGSGSKVWQFVHIMGGATIGKNCSIGQNVFIGKNVVIGNGCSIQNNVSIFDGCELQNNVFCGPSCTMSNDPFPRADKHIPREKYSKILIEEGASIGANATLVCKQGSPLIIGRGSFVGAGSVVIQNVSPKTVVVGNPAHCIGMEEKIEHNEKRRAS